MLDLIKRTRWDQATDFLASGDPPMIFRILAINTIFFIILIIRRARGLNKLNSSTLMHVQTFLIMANLLILFQRDIQSFLDRFI